VLVDLTGRTAGGCVHEWTIAQVFSHLGSGAEIGLAILKAGIMQEPGSDPVPIWDRWNALQPCQRRSANPSTPTADTSMRWTG
jgi:hypothetical protein